PGQAVLEHRNKKSSAAANRALVAAAATLVPETLIDSKPVCTQRGIVDRVGYVDAALDRDAVEVLVLCHEQCRDSRIGVGFVPDLAREYRRRILVAGRAQGAIGIGDTRRSARTIVGDDLKLEPSRRL